MTARIALMTARQKKVARHSLDAFAVLMVAVGIWLASGIVEVHPVTVHSPATSPVVEAPAIRI